MIMRAPSLFMNARYGETTSLRFSMHTFYKTSGFAFLGSILGAVSGFILAFVIYALIWALVLIFGPTYSNHSAMVPIEMVAFLSVGFGAFLGAIFGGVSGFKEKKK